MNNSFFSFFFFFFFVSRNWTENRVIVSAEIHKS